MDKKFAKILNELKSILLKNNIEIEILNITQEKKPYKFSVIPDRYPFSANHFGLSCEFLITNHNFDIDLYKKVGEIAKLLGLYWGGDFPHTRKINYLELLELLPNQSTKALVYLYKTPENFKKNVHN